MPQEQQKKIRPILLAGGKGARLWPLSVDEAPKPFIALPGMALTLFQQTVMRFGDRNTFLPPVIVFQRRHRALVEMQLKAVGVTGCLLIEEMRERNTAFAVARAVRMLERDGNEGNMCLVTPTDHWIDAPEAFCACIVRMAKTLATEALGLYGIDPGRIMGNPSAYGHIVTAGSAQSGWQTVTQFVEKPFPERVAAWRQQGVGSLINSGMVLGDVNTFRKAFQAHAPEIWEHALDEPEAAYPSFDIAVLQQWKTLCVTALPINWADLGSWPELLEHLPRDEAGNAATQGVRLNNAVNCVIFQRFPVRFRVNGVKNLVIIADDNALLVADMAKKSDHGQDLIWQHYPATTRFDAEFLATWSGYERAG